MKHLIFVVCVMSLWACSPGGRVLDQSSLGARDAQADESANTNDDVNEGASGGTSSGNDGSSDNTAAQGSAGNNLLNLVIDPVGELLEPVGLGFHVVTDFVSPAGEHIAGEGHGVDLLPVLIDVDGDASNGLLGADISVQVFALLTTFNVEVRKLPGAADKLPLKVEAIILDPTDILGLASSDLRVYLGYDSRESSAPDSYRSGIVVFDTLLDALPDITTATLNVQADGAAERLTALGGTFEESGAEGERFEALNIGLGMTPVPADTTVRVLFGDDVGRNEVELITSDASALQVAAEMIDGASSAPDKIETQSILFDALQGSVLFALEGANGLDINSDRDIRVSYDADDVIERLEIESTDTRFGVLASRIFARLTDVPSHWELEQTVAGRLSLLAADGIGLMDIGLADGTEIEWPAGQVPGSPFIEHALNQINLGAGVQSTALRLKGVRELVSDNSDGTYLKASLASAPLHVLSRDGEDYVDARVPNMPAEFELTLPDAGDLVSMEYQASSAADYLELRSLDQGKVLNARIEPLPGALSVCVSSNDKCGSQGSSTDASISFIASEPIVFNFDEQRGNEDRTMINDLHVHHLAISLGESSGFRKGYVFFDTDSTFFSGSILQETPSSGFEMSFSEGTFAEDRLVTWKNFIQTDRREGTMRCPGRQDLAIKAGGRFYDADFVVDTLCQ